MDLGEAKDRQLSAQSELLQLHLKDTPNLRFREFRGFEV